MTPMSKNILITGGAGFVGSNLAVFLRQRLKDRRIICLDNLVRPGSALNVPRLQQQGITFIQEDIRNKSKLLELTGIEYIIDCSAEPSVLAAYEDPNYTIDTNLMGTVNCLELARREGAHFIFLSTSRVYPLAGLEALPFEEHASRFDWRKDVQGPGVSFAGISHRFPLEGTRSIYGTTKLCSEMMVAEYCQAFGLKGAVTRFGLIAGPWQMGKMDQGIVGLWVAHHKFAVPLSYIGYTGQGKQVRDAIHIDDVCDLVLYQMTHLEKMQGKVYNAGGGRDNSFSLNELTALTAEICKAKIPIGRALETRKGDMRVYITDNALITRDLGWAPRKNLSQIIEDINSWMDVYQTQLRGILTLVQT